MVTKYECNDNRLKSQSDGDPKKKKADRWGILGREELGYCRQLPHGNDEKQNGNGVR